MSEVYRTLPEFPDYEITSDGDLRNRWSKRKLNESQNKNTGAWSYSIRTRDKRSTQRNFWGLVYSAWPELKPVEEPKIVKPKRAPRRKAENWHDIPGFPRYQISKDGILRYKSNKQLIKPIDNQVQLTTKYAVSDLMAIVFDEAA